LKQVSPSSLCYIVGKHCLISIKFGAHVATLIINAALHKLFTLSVWFVYT